MSTISITASILSPRVENLHDFIAGLRAIRSHGIAQNIHLHPLDKILVETLLEEPAAAKPESTHKAILHDKGYSLRLAAPVLGVHFRHLHEVLQGRRKSRRLLRAIEALPPR